MGKRLGGRTHARAAAPEKSESPRAASIMVWAVIWSKSLSFSLYDAAGKQPNNYTRLAAWYSHTHHARAPCFLSRSEGLKSDWNLSDDTATHHHTQLIRVNQKVDVFRCQLVLFQN